MCLEKQTHPSPVLRPTTERIAVPLHALLHPALPYFLESGGLIGREQTQIVMLSSPILKQTPPNTTGQHRSAPDPALSPSKNGYSKNRSGLLVPTQKFIG